MSPSETSPRRARRPMGDCVCALATVALVATLVPACFLAPDEEGSPIDDVGGEPFSADLGTATREDSLAFDVDPRRPLELTIAVLRCADSSDPVNFSFGYYTDGVGSCARGLTPVPLAGELASTDVDVRVRYVCGSVVSDETRPSLRKTGPSRLDGEYTATGAPDCVGSSVETEWRIVYERRVASQDLLFVWLARWTSSP